MLRKAKILVIDDEEDICNFSKSILEKTGKFEVKTSTDSINGLAIAKTDGPDLILLDINMPKMDGGAVAQTLQEYNITKDIPIIFLTALLRRDEAENTAGKIGRHFFLAKPVAPKELIEKLESILKI